MTDNELIEKVIRHDVEFKSLTKSLFELSDSMKQLTRGLEQVIVLNERLGSMDTNLKESFSRVHTRADDVEKKLDTFMTDMELVRIWIKYPKLTMCVAIGLYVMAFDSVRQSIFGI